MDEIASDREGLLPVDAEREHLKAAPGAGLLAGPGCPTVGGMAWWRRTVPPRDPRDSPVVAAALARAPASFADLVMEPGSPELALTRRQLLEYVSVSGGDGRTWELGVDDEVKAIIDTGPDVVDDDLMVAALEARPGVLWAQHPDRERYEFRLARRVKPDEALALCIDAIADAHRALARHLGIGIGESP